MTAPIWRGSQVATVELPRGTVLALDGEDWSYGRGQRPGTRFTLVVSRVRTELSGCYEGEWVWVDGHTPDCEESHAPCRQALVRVDALTDRLAPAAAR